MSRQIQIRRGTAAEHENFTGAIGEITMDTTNKTLRVHDGTTVGGTILAKQSDITSIRTMTSPDYTSGTSCTFSAETTATEDGYFEISGRAYNNTNLTIKINGVTKTIATSTNNTFSTTGFVLLPVSAGDKIQGTSSYNNTGSIIFYKMI